MGHPGPYSRSLDDVQIRKAARFLNRLVELSCKTTCLLRAGTGFEDNPTLSGQRTELMPLFLKSAVTLKAHEADLRNPALCEELRVGDILDSLVVTTKGAFVAVYELGGIHSEYH